MEVIGPKLNAVQFAMFSPDEIRKLAVIEVVTSMGLNALSHPIPGGLYDLRMGPNGEKSGPCATCQATDRNCPGHFGRIELPLPVVNPIFHQGLYVLMRMACTSCHRILIPGFAKQLLIAQTKLVDAGMVTEALNLEELVQGIKIKEGSENVNEVVVKEALSNYMKDKLTGLTFDYDTTMLEALRSQFLNDAVKQQVRGKSCCYCKAPLKPITKYQNRLISTQKKIEVADKYKSGKNPESGQVQRTTSFILPTDSKAILRSIWLEDSELIVTLFPVLKNVRMEFPTDVFFIEVVLVPPPKVRPLLYLQGRVLEPGQSRVYKNILNSCVILRNLKRMLDDGADAVSTESQTVIGSLRGESLLDKLNFSWADLQNQVDHLLDRDLSKTSKSSQEEGLKQIIEKKEGVLRMHMMGKRVNFAARSVITPDPNLNVEEIGIPEVFAKKLTYPEPFSGINYDQLRMCIENGPDVYPGANYVETSDGKITKLAPGEKNRRKRQGLAKKLLHSGDDSDPTKLGEKIVHRHLVNGDVLLLNRQPTLHRPSIMAHKARVLKNEKTLRMHYSNCKSYNADFDGDEMNAHFPQNQIARAEALNIVNVANQYLVPKDGTPLGGLIQDHVIAGVHLTVRGQMLNCQDYQQLVYQALSHLKGNIVLLPPAMIKPRRLWSGKQIISTILLNVIPKRKTKISIISSSKTNVKSWEKMPPRPWKAGGEAFDDPKKMSEAEVIVQHGELVCGVLDKQHFGATQYSLTHCLFELYGGECSSKFLNSLGKLFTFYLQLIGFTIGVEDILVLPKPDKKRRKIIEQVRRMGDVAATAALELETPPPNIRERLEEAYFQDKVNFRGKLDHEYKKALDDLTNDINKTCLPGGLIAKFPKNNLQLMVVAGAKGSTVNTMQISCLLGQIELEGKRPPLMLSGRSLPSFRPFETIPRAGGFIDGRFMTGILPQEFFFHCMAGREGLIDTAVKTSRSGYLQRCLIKHLEGLSVAYDHTVRNHDGTVVQFAYGEDGMEVAKAVFFKPSQMDFLFRNRRAILDKSVINQLKLNNVTREIDRHKAAITAWRQQDYSRVSSAFTAFSHSIGDSIKTRHKNTLVSATGRPKSYQKILKKWKRLSEAEQKEMEVGRCPDPVTAQFRPHRDFGAISEWLDNLMVDYLQSRPGTSVSKISHMNQLIALKSMSALCSPGEPVGLLAAQSIGEPSTQMTLNTFHFAGRGEMNVTLGIPRLREILMTASKKIKTPSMDIPLLPSSKAEKHALRMKRTLQRVTVSDVLLNVSVRECLKTQPSRVYTYTVRFNFLPHANYKKELNVTPALVMKHMEKNFMVTLSKVIRSLGKRFGELIHESQEERRVQATENDEDLDNVPAKEEPRNAGTDAESSDDDADADADASAERRRNRHQEAREYDEDTDDDNDSVDSEDEPEQEKDVEENDENVDEEITNAMSKEAAMRVANVLETFHLVKKYAFDLEKQEWCELTIGVPLTLSKIDFSTVLRDICDNSVIYEIRGIRRAFIHKTKKGETAIKTEGINLTGMSRFDKVLDLRRLFSNDVHGMAATYGIEAAGRVVVRELQAVFQVYGITVDPRHLLLIADYMTMQGVFLPLNRTGMGTGASALQQMTFESAISFLRKAVYRGRRDALASPSARIMIGRTCQSGTGSFDVFPKVVV